MSHADISGCPEHELHTQVEFATKQLHEGTPETEFRQDPDRTFLRKFFGDKLEFPDGLEVEIWGFEDETSGRGLPSPPIRAREGEIVHVTLQPSKRVHTIHLHGIEPDPRNDGVGHTSFEVTGEYTYQFRANAGVPGDPNEGMAGTYFYHCHVNTVLHVQMGMFGSMIFDPAEGRGKAFVDDPVGYDTRAETILVPYGVDPRWHEFNHAAGLDGEDVGLNDFRPTNFYALGADLDKPWPDTPVKVLDKILATARPDKPGLLRINNAGYIPTTIRFNDGLRAEVYSHDGRALRNTSVTPSPPTSVTTTLLGFGAAERYDMRLRPPAGARPGDRFSVTIEWHQWVTGEVLGKVTVPVEIIETDPSSVEEPETEPDAQPGPNAEPDEGGPRLPGDRPGAASPRRPAAPSPGPAAGGGGGGTAPARRRRRRPLRKRRKPVRHERPRNRKVRRDAVRRRRRRPRRR